MSSTIDNEDFEFGDNYLLTRIIEYNKESQFLYVFLETVTDLDVYGIDLRKKGDKLITIGWFFFSLTAKEKIVGGNSRVLV